MYFIFAPVEIFSVVAAKASTLEIAVSEIKVKATITRLNKFFLFIATAPPK